MKKLFSVLFVISVIALSGCSSNVDDYKDLMKKTQEELKNQVWVKRVSDAQKAMKVKEVADYFKVDDAYNKNTKQLNSYVKDISVQMENLKKIDDEEYNTVNKQLAKSYASNLLKDKIEFMKLITKIADEKTFVKDFKSKYVPEMKSIVAKKTTGLGSAYATLKTTIKSSLTKHKDRTKDINDISNVAKSSVDEIEKFKKDVNSINGTVEYKEMKPLYDTFTKVKTINYVEYINNLNSKLKELDSTYVKILKDKRAEYSAQVKGVTWDDYSDWNTNYNFSFPETIISENTYRRYKNGLDIRCNFYDCRSNKALNTLTSGRIAGIGKHGNTTGEFWIDDIYGEFYQKYDIIKNGKVIHSDWIEVDEGTYNKYYNAVGKTIYSKPYGKFDDEANDVTKPVGASLVGNPQYGHWGHDSNGNNVWFWIAAWSMMNNYHSTPYYHDYYSRYDSYRRPNNPYYNHYYGGSHYSTTGYNSGSSRTSRVSRTSGMNNRRYSYSSVNRSASRSISNPTIRNSSHSNMGRGSGGGGK